MATAFVYEPRSIDLKPYGVRRESTRPAEFRPSGFDEAHDDSTLFFDAAVATAGGKALLLAPPFNNLVPETGAVAISDRAVGRRLPFVLKPMDRHQRIWFDSANATTVVVRFEFGEVEIPVVANQCAFFAGQRTLVALSKNNPFPWIKDWLCYHRDVHGADAVLIYDNSSDIYDAHILCEELRTLDGIEVVCVVKWPFKFGPAGRVGNRRLWDSNYCQIGALEHARWMFLAEAASVLNVDIDELVVAGRGHKSIFQATEESASGVSTFHGLWVLGIEEFTPVAAPGEPVRHQAFEYIRVPRLARWWRAAKTICPTKWCVVPRRCPTHSQWNVHWIQDWPLAYALYWVKNRPAALVPHRGFSYRHFREISTSWKYPRTARVRFDKRQHVRDKALVSNFRKVRWQA